MPTVDKLSQVDRHRDTALRLSSPSAHPKVGRGKFYANTEGGYTFDTMKYGKHFDTLEDAARWLNANDWEVTGAGPIQEQKLRKVIREEVRRELRESKYRGFDGMPETTKKTVIKALEDIQGNIGDRELNGRLENVLAQLSRDAPDAWEELHDRVAMPLDEAYSNLNEILNHMVGFERR